MRVRVTGHNGYIGSVLVPVLEHAGHEVIGLDSDLFVPCTIGSNGHKVETLHTDVRDVESEDLAGFDAVVHLAAVRNDPVGDLNPQATYDINHLASVRVAAKAKEAGWGASCFRRRAASYQMSHRFVPEAARGVRWDDPAFGIDWPAANERITSERDRAWPDHRA